MVFGYIGLGERVFYLMTYQVFDTMMDTVLAAVAMFTFMGYVLESAGLMNAALPRGAADVRARCTGRSTSRRSSPRRCSPPPPASSAPR